MPLPLTRLLGLVLWAMVAAAATLPARAQDLRPVPVLSQQVMDQTGTLSGPQREALSRKLEAFERETGSQLVVLIVASSQPEDIAAYAQRVGDAWKIGRKDVGDGLLIVVAKNDRKVRIEVAKALEGAVPDLAARQIIQSAIGPAFKAGDYAGGLNRAVDQLQERVRKEALPAPALQDQGPAASQADGFDIESLIAFFLIGVPILGALLTRVFGRKLGSLVTSGLAGSAAGWFASSLLIGGLVGGVSLILVGMMDVGRARGGGIRPGRGGRGGMNDSPVIWGGSAGSWGGGGDSSSNNDSGGGFSSGGGGDFGGGGASGDW